MKVGRIFLLLLLLTALMTYYRQAGFDIIKLGYKFGRLYFNKEFIAELKVYENTVYVYAEPVDDQSLKILNLEQLQPVLKKAYHDYLTVIQNLYPEILEDHPKTAKTYPPKKSLTIIFVSPDTYESLSKIRERDSSGFVGFLDTIYFKTYGDNSQINGMKTTIRHEIFHYLNNYYGITSEFEEVAARRFSGNF